jgi:hypothetical protein
VVEEIEAARLLTDTVGAIHEFQALQLKMWPLMLFEGAKAEAHVDIGPARSEDDGNGNLIRKNRKVTVHYKVTTQSGCKKPRIQKVRNVESFKQLESWTKDLFWPDTKVRLFINNKEVVVNEQSNRREKAKRAKRRKRVARASRAVRNSSKS